MQYNLQEADIIFVSFLGLLNGGQYQDREGRRQTRPRLLGLAGEERPRIPDL